MKVYIYILAKAGKIKSYFQNWISFNSTSNTEHFSLYLIKFYIDFVRTRVKQLFQRKELSLESYD